jgi:hypothetical protein
MTVGTEETEVLEPVVIPSAVDVIEFKRNRQSAPRFASAHFASAALDTLLEQANLEPVR